MSERARPRAQPRLPRSLSSRLDACTPIRPDRGGVTAVGRFTLAWRGMRDLLARLASRGALGTLLTLMLLLPALLYSIATTLRDCMASQGCRRPARRSDRDAYVAYRYGGTQRFVNWREQRLVAALLRRIPPLRRVLDMPAGYGRFTLALQQVALEQVVCADIKPRRLRALARAPGVADRRMSLVAADLTSRLPFPAGTFDLVFNFRYLHHAAEGEARRATLAELVRVSRRYVILSYYRGSNLHAVQREVQRVTRENGRRGPDMLAPRELQGLAQALGCRILADRPLLPWFHAQRVALLETTPGTREGVAGSHVARSDPAPHERG